MNEIREKIISKVLNFKNSPVNTLARRGVLRNFIILGILNFSFTA